MSQIAKFAPFAALGLLLLVSTGCNQGAVSAETLAKFRSELALADEPEELQTVSEVRLTLLGECTEDHDHAEHDHAEHADHDHADHEHGEADHDEHAEHDHQEHADHDHADHAHSEAEEHADHDHEAHAEHDHGEADHDEAHLDEHADHDHAEHADHDHEAEHDHAHEAEAHVHVHAAGPIEVAMVGHIGGLPNPWAEAQQEYPFSKSQAVLFLADPQAVVENEAHAHSHAPGEECAFCAAHAADQADMLAVVQFVDENGRVLPMDVRQLFDVKEQDTVVVRGKARVTEGGILVVDARGMYVRR